MKELRVNIIDRDGG